MRDLYFVLNGDRACGAFRVSIASILRDEMTPVLPGQTIAIDPGAVKAFRPTYRVLSYCLVSNEFPVSNDLAGIDRPDLVNALVHEIYGWAGLMPPH